MTVTDAGLSFWLRYVDATGGLVEENGDTTLVVLPEDLQRRLDLPEELQVTADPDVARDAGVTFLGAGHPALGRSADEVLAIGDVAACTIAAPAALPPSIDHLQDAARNQFTVEHGRIDASGSVTRGVRPILRVGAIVDYTLSAEDRYQEVAECWMDARSLRPIATSTAERLVRCDLRPTEPRPGDLIPVVAAADRYLDHAATRRRAELGSDVDKALTAELERVETYYRDQLAQIARRANAAPPDRRELYDARAESTRGEHARRLAETREKYRASHTIRPFRLHLVEVPVWRVPVDVRRGDRRYPLTLDYLMPVGAYAEVPCPNCGSGQTLVATKSTLACTACQVRAVPAPPRAPKPTRPTQPKPTQSRPTQPKPTQPKPPAPEAPAAKRRPPTPPRQPSPGKIGRIGDRLVGELWKGVATDNDRLAQLCADGSPAAAAVRLFGARGLGYAIGLPVSDVPSSAEFHTFPGEPTRPHHCAGTVDTAGGRRYPFALRWAATGPSGSVEEILPYARPFPAGQLFPGTGGPGDAGMHGPPVPRAPLGPVGETLWRRTLPDFDLSVTLRCLAALWRLPDESALAAAHGPTAVAAGLERMICMRAGIGRGHYAEVAAAFRVTERVLRRVNTDLQARLQLGSDTFW